MPVVNNEIDDVAGNSVGKSSVPYDTRSDTYVSEIDGLTDFYLKNKDNLKCAHLNINSLRYKFIPLKNVLCKSLLDILSLQETKLDNSFPMAQFFVQGYRLHRKDHQKNSGGLLMLIRDDLPQCRRKDLEAVNAESGRVEILALELVLRKEKWLLLSVYKQPQVKNACIVSVVEGLLDRCCQETRNILMFGDFNVNMANVSNCLHDTFCGGKNLVNTPTCFKGDCDTLIDLMVTTVPKRIQNVTVVDCDLSDFHRMVLWATKLKAPIRKKNYFIS